MSIMMTIMMIMMMLKVGIRLEDWMEQMGGFKYEARFTDVDQFHV